MATTNQQGMITKNQTQGSAALANKQASPTIMMKRILDNQSIRSVIEGSLKENSGAFVASLIELYNTDKTLQSCDPAKVAQEALKAVSLKLPISKQLGFAYIIPYNKEPQFQIGYKGYIQLCMRTGAYKYINAGPVYEGELTAQDKITGDIKLDGEPISDKIIGYFAYIETINGFRKCLYWTKEKVISHAGKHSKSYQAGNKIWKDFFDEMAAKTVLRNLLSKYGVMSVDMERAFSAEVGELADGAIRSGDNNPIPDDTHNLEDGRTVDGDGVIIDVDPTEGPVNEG